VVPAGGDTEPVEQVDGAGPGPAGRGAGERGRQLDVLDRGELVDQVEGLEDEADGPAPQHGPGGLGQAVDPGAVEHDLAGVRALQAAEQVQQGRLAAAARPHDRHGLAGLDGQVDAVHGPDRGALGGERLDEPAPGEDRVHWCVLRPHQ
jgi:hypothetical protein